MSDLKWDSLKLRQHLRAMSCCYDDTLKKNGLDPTLLRSRFNMFFNKKYKPMNNIISGMKMALELDEYKNYLIFDLDRSYIEKIDGWTDGYNHDCYLFIGETKSGDFVSIDFEFESSELYGTQLNDGEWLVKNKKPADFIDLTLKYQQIIISICTHWGYEPILQWIKKFYL